MGFPQTSSAAPCSVAWRRSHKMSQTGQNYNNDPMPDGSIESMTAANRYSAMKADREPFLVRARRLSKITIASLFRNEGDNGTTETPEAWQSFGAYCINNLASKLGLTVFPPGISPIRLDPSKNSVQDIMRMAGDEEAKGNLMLAIDKGLRESEMEFTRGITEDMDSAVFVKGMRYKLVGGTHGYQQYQDGTWRGITLDSFTNLRDGQGNLLEFVIEDNLVWDTLPKGVRNYLEKVRPEQTDAQGRKAPAYKVCLYTHGVLNEDGEWEVYQECCGYKIPNTSWTYQKDYLPFLFVPFNLLPGEHYGRTYVEDYESDLQGLDGGEEILTEGTAAAALLIRLVKPGGVTNKEALAKARNGAVITGDGNDVSVLQTNKGGDFAALEKRVESKESRLARAFLLNFSVQRQAERVTAEEIRYLAQALNEQLGSLYLELVKTYQSPWAKLKMAALMRLGRMTPLPKNQVNVQMATGAAALSRAAELQNLDDLTMPPNPIMQQQAARVLDPVVYFRQRAIKIGIYMDGLVKTQDRLDKEDQQAAQQAMQQQAMPNLIKAGADLSGKAIDHASNMAQIGAQQSQDAQPSETPAQ